MLEDNEFDAELIARELKKTNIPSVLRYARTGEEFRQLLRSDAPDIILSDYRLPDLDGLAALQLARASHAGIPFIVISGTLADDSAVNMLKHGATDFISKDRLSRLPLAIEHAVQEMQQRIERSNAEALLTQTEERYQVLFENNPSPTWVFDVHSLRMLAVNAAAIAHYGYSREEFLAMSIVDIRPPEDTALFHEAMTQWPLHRIHDSIWRHRKKDGSIIMVELRSHDVRFEGHDGRIVVVKDITERIRAEAELAQSFSLLRATLDSTADGILVVNLDQGIETFNRKFLEIWRIPQQILDSGGDDEALHYVAGQLKDPSEFIRKVRELYSTPAAISFDLLELNDGRFFERYSQPQFTGENITGRIWSFRDVSERKRTEEQLQTSHRQLRALAARLQSVKEEESARIAREIHDELGQALTGLKMDLKWLEKRIPEQAPLHDRIASMTELITTTISTVRRIATELRPGVLDALGLISAIEWQAQEFHARTGIRTHVHFLRKDILFTPEQSTVLFRLLQEALTNIIRHAHASIVTITLEPYEHGITLQIEDNGRGITDLELHDPHSLGLLGMRERVQPWGGTLAIGRSATGGTTVTVHLPLTT